jgi:hypothetical protein
MAALAEESDQSGLRFSNEGAAMSQLDMFTPPKKPALKQATGCDITPVGKRRDGGTRYWCVTHKADATAKYGRRATECRAAHLPPILPHEILDLDLDQYPGGVGLWGAVPPVYDTTCLPVDFGIHVHARRNSEWDKDIDATYRAVRLIGQQLPTEGLLISEIDAVYYMVSSVFGFGMRDIRCTYCGYPHLDKDWFSIHPHRRHLCAGCGKNFRDSLAGIGNPIRATQEILGLLPRKPVQAAKVLSLRQSDYPGGIQVWGSNAAIIWSSEKAEEEGIHVHAYKADHEIPNPDDTFSAVEIDGVRLDPAMVRTLMAQNSLPHLEARVVSLKCSRCDEMEFSCGEQAFTPVVGRICSKCQGVLSGPTRLRRTIGNPLIATLKQLSASAPRPPQKHATGLLIETL